MILGDQVSGMPGMLRKWQGDIPGKEGSSAQLYLYAPDMLDFQTVQEILGEKLLDTPKN